ncbi:MAG: RNA 2',3'-cyclic phosphodiesterase [Desulfobacter sp.]|nr:MAG: RNA 2',3'-cyclic phosphodiesterase [Desulfobacter sp.]
MPDSKLRCFISLTLPNEVIKRLRDIQQQFKASGIRASWPSPKGFHVTLAFLGDRSLAELPGIQSAMAESAAKVQGFRLRLGRPGVFPGARNPRVLWMGLGGEIDRLQRLHTHLASSLRDSGLGLKKQRFSPHITIGRIKGRGGGPALKAIFSTCGEFKESGFRVDAIHLYESQLNPSGAVHTRLYTAHLGG